MKQKFRDICYSFGNFSGGIVNYAMSAWFMYFYVDKMELDTKYYGIAMVIYGIWNAINDPMMGIISDKTRSRWGRRKPYMMFGAVPLGLSLVLLFSPPMELLQTQVGLLVFFVVSLCIYDTFFTMTMLTWSAALPEMYLDEKNRARVNVYSQILGVLGAMIATVAVQPIINAFNFQVMAIIFGAIGIVTMLMSAYGVRERAVNSQAGSLTVVQSFKATFTNKAFLICVTSVLMVEVGKVICTATMAFYSDYVMKNELGVTIIMGVMFASSMVFAPLISFLCNRVGAKKTYIISTVIFALGCAGYMLAPGIVAAAIVSVVAGIGVSGVMIMPNMLYAEIIDDDQVRTGVRREGAFYGMNALVMRLSIVLQGAITALVFDGTGYVANAAEQTASAVWGIRVLMGLVPLVFSGIAIIILLFYPIDKVRLAEVQARVRELNGDDNV